MIYKSQMLYINRKCVIYKSQMLYINRKSVIYKSQMLYINHKNAIYKSQLCDLQIANVRFIYRKSENLFAGSYLHSGI